MASRVVEVFHERSTVAAEAVGGPVERLTTAISHAVLLQIHTYQVVRDPIAQALAAQSAHRHQLEPASGDAHLIGQVAATRAGRPARRPSRGGVGGVRGLRIRDELAGVAAGKASATGALTLANR